MSLGQVAARAEPPLILGLPAISATMTDSLPNDVNGSGLAHPGDTVHYTVVVSNTGSADALGLVFSDTIDANTTLTGTVHASPLARDDVYTATKDTALLIGAGMGLLANDFGQPAPSVVPHGAAPTAQGGTVTLNADGSFTYNPPSGYTGSDSFNYTATNSAGTDTGLVSIHIYALPVAVNDSYSSVQNTPLVVTAANGVLINDTANGATISAFAANSTQGGIVSLALDGSFVYTPTTGFFSPPTDTFTYTLSNAVGRSTATVSIAVNLPGPPVAVSDAYTATANTPLKVPAPGVLANDTVNSANITGYAATTSHGGSVTLQANGSFIYTPTLDFLSPPVDTFTYTLTNLIGSSTATVTLTVRPAGPPVAVDDAYTATANTPLSVSAPGVLGNDTLNFATLSGYQANTTRGGTVVLAASGAFTYTPPAGTISPPTDSFTYTLSNVLGNSTATVRITIVPPGPPVAVDDAYTATANTLLSVSAPGVFGNDTLNFATLSGYQANTTRGGTVVLDASGAFTYTPPSGTISPPTDSYTYTLSNVLGNSTATVTLAINPPGSPIAVDDNYTTTANTLLNVPAPGVLGNDTVRFATITGYQASTARGGTVTLHGDGSFSYTPPADVVSPPDDTFTYTLTNVLGNSTATAHILINPPASPVAVDDSYTATANTQKVVAAPGVLGNDTPNFATITSYQANTARGGSVVLAASGAFTYTPPAGVVSPPADTFTYTLGNLLGTSTATATITIEPPGPPLAVNDTYTTSENVTRTVAAPGVLGNDTPNFATITSYQANTAQGGSVVLAASGAFTYTPPTGVVSPPDDTFTYTLSNSLGASTATATITIYPPPPVAVDDAYSVTGNIEISVPVSGVLANDTVISGGLTGFGNGLATANGTAPGGTVTTTNGGTVVLQSDGSFTYDPPPGFDGVDHFYYTLSNITAGVAATVTLTVSQTVWFVNNSASAGDGRLQSPYNSLGSLQSAVLNDAGDVIFVYQGVGDYSGGLSLKASQTLIGQGVDLGSALVALGVTLAPNSLALPVVTSNPNLVNAGGNALTLSTNNTVRGVNLGDASGVSLGGSSFGTLNADTVNIHNTTGAGLSLVTGTANVTFGTVSATGGVNGISLTTVSGTLNLGGGAISGATGATVSLSGGTAIVNYSGDLTQTNNSPLVSVSGGHSGALTFQTGTLSATNGTGLRFDNANGTYAFSGTNTLNGGAAGIDIRNGSTGTFTFSSNTSVTNPSGTAFNLDTSPANVTYSGSLSGNAGLLLDINNHNGGMVTFQTGTLNSTSQGLRVRNSSGGTISFNNPAKLLTTGSNAAVMLSNNAGSIVNFSNGGLTVNTTSGGGFSATGGGTVNVTGANNTLTSTTGTAALLSGVGGTLLFRSIAANGASNGIWLNNTIGSFEVSGDGASDPANTTRGRTTAKSGGGTLALGSGGTIAGTTGPAVLLSNAANVTLRNMTLSTSAAGGSVNDGRDGIRASGSSNLTLDNMLMDGNGNGLANNSALNGSALAGLTIIHSELLRTATTSGVEGLNVWGVTLTDLTGNASAAHSIFDTSRENVFGLIETGSLVLTLTVSNSLFQHADVAGVGNNGLGISANNSARVSLTVDGSTFQHVYGNGIQYTGNDSSGGGLIQIQNSTFDDDGTSINLAHQGQDHTVQFNIKNNHIRDSGIAPGVPGNALNAVNLVLGSQSNASSGLEGYLTGNTIGNASLAFSGSAQGVGVYVANSGPGTLTISASNNTIREIQQDNAFWAFGSNQSGTANMGTTNLTLTGNDFMTNQTAGTSFAGLGLNAGADPVAIGGDSPTICANLLGNISFTGTAPYGGINLALTGTNPNVKLVGYSGNPNDDAAVKAFLDSAAVATTVAPPASITRAFGSIQSTPSCPAPSFIQGSVQSSHVLAAAPLAQPAVASDVHLARLASPAPQGQGALVAAATTVQMAIGSLPAGKVVTITFDVVIANPVPVGTTQVSNQAHISGSNFAAVLSDDPDAPGPNAPTVTLLAPPTKFPIYLPLVFNAYTALPDLVGSFSLSPNQKTFSASELVTITAVVSNIGTAPASGFWVDFYLNPSSPPTHANQVWDTLCSLSPCYGIAWRVDTTLAPGQSITLTSTPGSYWAPNTIWPGHFASGTTDLYMYVDSYSNPATPNGAVLESNETNNRSELHGLQVTGVAGAPAESVRRPEDLPPR